MPYFYPGISKSSTHISDFSLLNVTEMEAEAWRNEINVSKFMLWVRTRARNRLALNIPEMMKGQDKTQDSLVRWSCLFPLTRARIHCAQSKADEMGALTLPAQFLSALVSHFPIYVCVFLLVRRCLAAPCSLYFAGTFEPPFLATFQELSSEWRRGMPQLGGALFFSCRGSYRG